MIPAVVFGLVAVIPWGGRVGVVLGAVVVSHWVLDQIVHLVDLPILACKVGGMPCLGFELRQCSLVAA